MSKIKDFLEAINYKLSDSNEYLWDCFGHEVYQLNSHVLKHCSASITYDSRNQTVYKMEVWDESNIDNLKAYRWINPKYLLSFKLECKKRKHNFKKAIDNFEYIEQKPYQILNKIKKLYNE